MDDTLLYLVYLAAGLTTGLLIGYLLARIALQRKGPDQEEFVRREMHDHLQQELEASKLERQVLQEQRNTQQEELATLKANNQQLTKKMQHQNQHFLQLQQQARLEFEQTANRILDEKTQKFSQQNQNQLEHLLRPLKEKIKEFEEGIERKFLDDAKEKMSLREAIFNLKELNTQLSEDANR
ncbi:MAG: hypothetical protein AAFU60_07030, partial [Bacteroidota bacterium]